MVMGSEPPGRKLKVALPSMVSRLVESPTREHTQRSCSRRDTLESRVGILLD